MLEKSGLVNHALPLGTDRIYLPDHSTIKLIKPHKTMKANQLKRTVLASLCAAALALTSCGGEFVRGRGDVVTETRSVPTFDAVEADGDFEVYLTQGPAEDIRLEGQNNILDVVTTKVDGRELEIKFKSFVNVRRHKPIRIYITNPSLTSLDLAGSGRAEGRSDWNVDDLRLSVSGSGSIDMDIIGANDVNSRISGSGNMYMSGDADQFESEISGSGNVRAFGLVTKRANMKISGSGNSELTVTQSLDARISGSGNVRYKGSPTVNASVSGSGKVIRAD